MDMGHKLLKLLVLCVAVSFGAAVPTVQAQMVPASAPSPVEPQTLVPYVASPDGGLTFQIGKQDGLTLGQQVVLLSGWEPLSLGRLTVLSEHHCTIEPDGPRPRPTQGLVGMMLLPKLETFRDRGLWPVGAVLSGKMGETSSRTPTAKLTGESAKLLRRGDAVLIWQAGLPIARGEDLELLPVEASLITPEPAVRLVTLVAGREPATGDDWTLIRSDDPAGWRTAVLQVTREPAEDVVLLAANEKEGVRSGMIVDFFRAGQFIARGEVTEVGKRLAEVRVVPAMARLPVQMSDLARIYAAAPKQGRLFRLDGAEALTSVPETSGVQVGQPLGVYRAGVKTGTIKVEAVKEGYCRGTLTPLSESPPQVWDDVYLFDSPKVTAILLRPTPAETVWQAKWLSAQPPKPGQWLGLYGAEGCTGLVVTLMTQGDKALVWLVPSWQTATPAVGQPLRGME